MKRLLPSQQTSLDPLPEWEFLGISQPITKGTAKRRKITNNVPPKFQRFIDQDQGRLEPRSHPLDVKQIELEFKRTRDDPIFNTGHKIYGHPPDYLDLVPFETMREVFVQSIRHITHTEFLQLLNKIANEFHRKYHPKPYTMVIPGFDRCKSNFWVAQQLLSKTIMREYAPVEVIGKCNDADTDLVVIPDDGLFSGQQMEAAIERCSGDLDVVVLVAVATNRALSRLARHDADVIYGDKIENLTDTIERLGGKYTEAYKDILSSSRARSNLELAVMYFDHKVPDEQSVVWEIRDFIGGCRARDISDETKADQSGARRIDECPVPPYKINPSCWS